MLNRLSIKFKIGLIALIGLLGFVVFQAASYNLSINLRNQTQHMIEQDFVLLQFANKTQVEFTALDNLYQAALAESEIDTLHDADEFALGMLADFETKRAEFKISNPLFFELVENFKSYRTKATSHTSNVINEGLNIDRLQEGYQELDVLRKRYRNSERSFLDNQYIEFERKLKQIERQETEFVVMGLMLGGLLSCILLMVSIFIIRHLTKAFDNAVDVAEKIADGHLDYPISTTAQDETGALITALISMRSALKKQDTERARRQLEQDFLAELNEVMRGDKTRKELAHEVIYFLLKSFGAESAACYIVEEKEWVLLTGINYPDSCKILRQALGETVLGVAAQMGEVHVQAMPLFDSHNLASGQKSVLFYPVLFEDKLNALIELNSNEAFQDEQIKLLKRATHAIGVSFSSALAREKVSTMLRQTQEQAEELQYQREELKQINQELEDKTINLDLQRNEILRKNMELERSGIELKEKTQALEVSGKYKSQFLSTMSHELRTPLNSILILSEALIQNRNAHLDDKELQHVRVINSAGSDLLELINDILDLSKVEEGKMEIVIDNITIADFANSITQQFEFIARNKGLDFTIKLATDIPKAMYTDKHRLKQILRNFISNALKFTERGNVQVLVCRPDQEFIEKHVGVLMDDCLLFRVKDTGIGVDVSKQAIIFEAFRQADGTTSRKYGGTGLGLSISTALSKLLGGNIVMDSQGLGLGSEFTLILPVVHPDCEKAIELAENKDQFNYSRADMSSLSMAYQHDYKYRDELLLVMSDKQAANRIMHKASTLNIDCQWISNAVSMDDILGHYHFSLALIDESLISTYTALQKRSLFFAIDRCYLLADERVQAAYFNYGVSFVYNLLDESIDYLLDDVLEYQRQHASSVLVIEDNPVFQEVLKAVFTKHYLNVSIAGDGKSALDFIGQQNFDCFIVDLNLPDYCGVELLEKIRVMPNAQQQPIIVFTAEELEQDCQKEILKYASQILLKTPKAIVTLHQNAKNLIYSHKNIQNTKVKLLGYIPGILTERRVLIVDDDIRNIYSLSAILEAEGLIVHTCQSGEEALDFLNSHPILDIILLDIMMPEMDGYEVLHRIRGDMQWQRIPIIAVTAKVMMGDYEKCLQSGATDYLAKPVDRSLLLDSITANLS